MPQEILTYAELAERLSVTSEAARALVKRLRLPRSKANDGKALVRVDLSEISHTPMSGRSPGGHQADAPETDGRSPAGHQADAASGLGPSLERSPGGDHLDVTLLQTRIAVLQVELMRLEATAARDRMDFEYERERAQGLLSELLKATTETMTAKADVARLEGAWAAWNARPWWQKLLAG
jgi:hypothetical protein